MNNAFWQSIVADGYAVPAGASPASLARELIALLGSPDPVVRDEYAYPILAHWIEDGRYAPEAMRAIGSQTADNLKAGIGEQGTDSVFLRSFSALILDCVIEHDNNHPFLEEVEVRQWVDEALAYLAGERDLRGYIPVKGWAHSAAHTADLLMDLANNRHLGAADLERILNAIAAKVQAPVAHVYLYLEDERLACAVMTALRRDLLAMPFLAAWLDRIARTENPTFWYQAALNEIENSIHYNTTTFLRSLYFQLLLAENPPALAPELLPAILKTLRTMDLGFYALP